MARTKRLILSLTDETYEALKKVAKASQMPMSAIPSDIIEDARPAILAMADMFTTVRSDRLSALDKWGDLLAHFQGQASQHQLKLGELRRSARTTKAPRAIKKKSGRAGGRGPT